MIVKESDGQAGGCAAARAPRREAKQGGAWRGRGGPLVLERWAAIITTSYNIKNNQSVCPGVKEACRCGLMRFSAAYCGILRRCSRKRRTARPSHPRAPTLTHMRATDHKMAQWRNNLSLSGDTCAQPMPRRPEQHAALSRLNAPFLAPSCVFGAPCRAFYGALLRLNAPCCAMLGLVGPCWALLGLVGPCCALLRLDS